MLLSLPRRQRAAIGAICGLYYGERLSTAEVARRLSTADRPIAESTVYNICANFGDEWRKRYLAGPAWR